MISKKNNLIIKYLKYLTFLLLLCLSCQEIPDKPERDNIFDPEANFDSVPPSANITVSQDTGFINETYFEFSAVNSLEDEHPDAVLYYKWDFNNDGVWDTELTSKKTEKIAFADPEHSVNNSIRLSGPGNQIVTLYVLGALNKSSTTSYTIYVYDHPKIVLDWEVDIFSSRFYFYATGSADWTGSQDLEFRWDYDNDGNWDTDWIKQSSMNYLAKDSFGDTWETKLSIKDSFNFTTEKIMTFTKPNLDGIIAYFPFSGNAQDLSGNGIQGVVYGAVATKDRFGNQKSAYYFDGANDYIDLGNNDKLKSTEQFSLSVWIKNERQVTSAYPNVGIFTNNDNCDQNYGLKYWIDKVTVGNGNSYSYHYGMSSYLNIWKHFVITFSSDNPGSYDNLKIFIDKIKFGGTWSSDISSIGYSSSPTVIGKICNYFFQGIIDEVYIFNRSLTSDDIQNLYHSKN